MYCLNTPQWAQAMKEKLDFLHKNKMWIIVSKNKIKSDH